MKHTEINSENNKRENKQITHKKLTKLRVSKDKACRYGRKEEPKTITIKSYNKGKERLNKEMK